MFVFWVGITNNNIVIGKALSHMFWLLMLIWSHVQDSQSISNVTCMCFVFLNHVWGRNCWLKFYVSGFLDIHSPSAQDEQTEYNYPSIQAHTIDLKDRPEHVTTSFYHILYGVI